MASWSQEQKTVLDLLLPRHKCDSATSSQYLLFQLAHSFCTFSSDCQERKSIHLGHCFLFFVFFILVILRPMWGLIVPESGDLPMVQSVVAPMQRQAKGFISEQVAVGQGVSIRRECGTQQAHDCTTATHPYISTAPTQCTLAIQNGSAYSCTQHTCSQQGDNQRLVSCRYITWPLIKLFSSFKSMIS